MKDSNVVLYVHGGPGFNSIAEEQLMTPVFKAKEVKCIFWNEPSFQNLEITTKENNAFGHLCDSIIEKINSIPAEKVHLMVHSFAVQPLLQLNKKLNPKITKLTLIAPATALNQVYRNVLKIAESDFKISDSDKAELISQYLKNSKSLFDESMQQGFSLAAEDPSLFPNYWYNKIKMAEFFEIWGKAGAGVNIDSFTKVITSMAQYHLPEVPQKISIPTKIAYGAHDLIVKIEDQEQITADLFNISQHKVFENSAHYLHLEETEKFLTWSLQD